MSDNAIDDDWGVCYHDLDDGVGVTGVTANQEMATTHASNVSVEWLMEEQRTKQIEAELVQLKSDEELATALHISLNEVHELRPVADQFPDHANQVSSRDATVTRELIHSISCSLKEENPQLTEDEILFQLEQILGESNSDDGDKFHNDRQVDGFTVPNEMVDHLFSSSQLMNDKRNAVQDDRFALFFHKVEEDDDDGSDVIEHHEEVPKAASFDISHSASNERWVDVSEIRRVLSEDGSYYLTFKKEFKKKKKSFRSELGAASMDDFPTKHMENQANGPNKQDNRMSLRTTSLIVKLVEEDERNVVEKQIEERDESQRLLLEHQASIRRQAMLDRNASIKAFRYELFDAKRSSLPLVPYAFPTNGVVASHWENTNIVVENVNGGLCVSVVLPYLRQVDVSLRPCMESHKQAATEASTCMGILSLAYYECKKSVYQNFLPHYWNGSKVSKLYGVCEKVKASSGISSTLATSPVIRMLSRSMSASIPASSSAPTNHSTADHAIVPDVLRSRSFSRSPSFSESPTIERNDVSGNSNSLPDDFSPVGKRGLLKFLSRSGSQRQFADLSGVTKEEGKDEELDMALSNNEDGGLPNLRESYGCFGNAKYDAIRVKIHAFRYLFPHERNWNFENTEFMVDLKLDGWHNTLSQHHISTQYDKDRGLLLVHISAITSTEVFEFEARNSLQVKRSQLPRNQSPAYHVKKQPFFPMVLVASKNAFLKPFRIFQTATRRSGLSDNNQVTNPNFSNISQSLMQSNRVVEGGLPLPTPQKPPLPGKSRQPLVRRPSDHPAATATGIAQSSKTSSAKPSSPRIKRNKSVDSTMSTAVNHHIAYSPSTDRMKFQRQGSDNQHHSASPSNVRNRLEPLKPHCTRTKEFSGF